VVITLLVVIGGLEIFLKLECGVGAFGIGSL